MSIIDPVKWQEFKKNHIPYNLRKAILTYPDFEVIDRKTFNLEHNGTKFYPFMSGSIELALQEYDYSDIRPTDIVLDIGANVGGFSCPVAPKCKQLFALEPIYKKELCRNVLLNNLTNVNVAEGALSNFKTITCKFEGKSNTVGGCNLTEIINHCGGHIDFLKCDCEGAEWIIQSHEFEGMRRIEMELHLFKGKTIDEYKKRIEDAGFEVILDETGNHKSKVAGKHSCILHCFKN